MDRKKIISVSIVVICFTVAAYLVYTTLKKPAEPNNSSVENVGNMVAGNTSTTSVPLAQSTPKTNENAQSAKSAITKFILATANPSKPASEADKQAAVAMLDEQLKSQVGGDPAKLFTGTSRPTSFVVADPTIRRDVAAVVVTFKFNGQPDVKFNVSLKQQENGQWQITAIERINVRTS